MAAERVRDGDQVLGYALYQVCTLTLIVNAAVFLEYTVFRIH